ncbi:MAG: TIM barrel protein [Succinivibrio sp.]
MTAFKLGCNEACTRDIPDLKADIIGASRAGFDFIEMRFDCVRAFLEKGGRLAEIGFLFEDLPIKPATQNALYLYPHCLEDGDHGERRDALERDLELLEMLHEEAHVQGAIVVPPLLQGAGEASAFERGFVLEDCARALDALASRLPWCNLAFEPVGLSRSLVRSLGDALEIVRKAGSPRCTLALDSCNLFLERLKSDFDFSALKASEIGAVHLMNGVNPGHRPVDQSFRRFCGDGEWVDTGRFVRELLKTGYAGMVSAEVFHLPCGQEIPREDLIAKACSSLKLAIANALCGKA